jgi:hypothetical protein
MRGVKMKNMIVADITESWDKQVNGEFIFTYARQYFGSLDKFIAWLQIKGAMDNFWSQDSIYLGLTPLEVIDQLDIMTVEMAVAKMIDEKVL